MCILLRDTTSKLYFQGPDRWTQEPSRAFDFRFIDRAMSYCQTWGLTGVELAFAYENPPQVITVPLEWAGRRMAPA